MTIPLALPTLILSGFSLLLFVIVTACVYKSGLFDGGGIGWEINAPFALVFYAIFWAIPSLLAWAAWATWGRA